MGKILLLFSIPVFIISIIVLFRYYNHSSEKSYSKEITKVNSLLKEGKVVVAKYDSVYTVVKRRDQPMGYSIGYSFKVGDKVYTDTKDYSNINELPKELYFDIYYLEKDPEIHMDDLQQNLVKYTKKLGEERSPKVGWWMFFCSILAFLYGRWTLNKEIREESERADFIRQNQVS